MAALVLTTAASAVSSAIGLSGITASLLSTAAALGGGLIDAALFGGGRGGSFSQTQEGPRLNALDITSSTEGAAIKRVYGRARIGGEIIWATRLEEEIVTRTQTSGGGGGGKGGFGGGGGGATVTTTTTEYRYYANFAVGLSEGPVAYLNRAWADGKELDLSKYVWRFYPGTETQEPDSLIETKEGIGNVPAYRGLAYVVFERMPLARFGNRIPQLTFEIIRPATVQSFEPLVRGVNLIPGTTEFGYEPETVKRVERDGAGNVKSSVPENTHLHLGKSDWSVSLDHLNAALPNANTICLVVSWFSDDLRCGEARIFPKVENHNKDTVPHRWSAGGLTRTQAEIVSYSDGRPAVGGAPNDASVVRAIRDLKARGFKVMLYPFIMCDIANGNGLPDPYGGGEQAAYPWRGRITCHPAPGISGSPDKTLAAGGQVADFVGTAAPAHFSVSGDAVSYSGPAEWSFRRFILHCANLAKAAGGVDSICLCSEMVGMTSVRDGADSYPFVDALINLAGDVRAVLGAGVKIGYGANWSEYHSHRPADGSGDVFFNLDPIWADANIDFIGIDNYLPLADWRDGNDHADHDPANGHTTIYDLGYLKSNVEGGEYYDWYYASEADRAAQIRSPITDGAYGEPWIYRNKDLKSWWQNAHHNRPGGVRSATPTDWAPGSKPIWFTELGCPAIDKGANQPNVFFDPKSSESELPHFSTGARDDVIQRQYLRAMLEYWDPESGNNPAATLYAGHMVDPDNILIWSWDARPFPSYPLDGAAWGDAPNWRFGHWLSARVGTVYVPDMMASIANDYGFVDGDYSAAYGACDGYIVDRIMSLRDAWSALGLMYFFDLVETGAKIRALTRHSTPVRATIDNDGVADTGSGELAQMTRAQETEIPRSFRLKYLDSESGYRSAAVEARRLTVTSDRVSEAETAIVIDQARAQQAADLWLADLWAGREQASIAIPPSALALEPGDVIRIEVGPFGRDVRLTSLVDGAERRCSGASFAESLMVSGAVTGRAAPIEVVPAPIQATPVVWFLDLPLLQDGDNGWDGYVAAHSAPWPGVVSLYRTPTASNWSLKSALSVPAVFGTTLSPLYRGPVAVWDRGNTLRVELYSGELASLDDLSLFAGGNAFAIETPSGEWEVFQARDAALVGTRTYDLSMLVRGQLGTEHAMGDPVPAGARIIFLSAGGIGAAGNGRDDIGIPFNWRFGPADDPIEADTYTTQAHAFRGVGLRPFAPVHVRATKDRTTGDVLLGWQRRTRIGGDSWLGEVPLGEETEAYEIDILDAGGAVKRTLTVAAPEAVYTAAQQIDDFGGPATAVNVAVHQISATYGRGAAGHASLTV